MTNNRHGSASYDRAPLAASRGCRGRRANPATSSELQTLYLLCYIREEGSSMRRRDTLVMLGFVGAALLVPGRPLLARNDHDDSDGDSNDGLRGLLDDLLGGNNNNNKHNNRKRQGDVRPTIDQGSCGGCGGGCTGSSGMN